VLNGGQSHTRFLNACRIHAAFQHDHVPPLLMVGENASRCYAIRTFVDGDDLLNNIRGRAMAPGDLVRIVTTVASALDAMHGRELVHGCVHPRHLLQDRNESIWLIGFGEWPPGEVIGNPLHLAPEQLDQAAGPVGPQTDVYQLAETAAWLLAGRHPFQDWRRPEELFAAKRSDDGWRTGPFRNLPGRVAAAFGRALAPDPADRYPMAGEFAAALAAAFAPRSRWRFW
jgi:serine/threonine-protein kinase